MESYSCAGPKGSRMSHEAVVAVDHLTGNLLALQATTPELAQRIMLPAENSYIFVGEDQEPFYRVHNTLYRFQPSIEDLPGSLKGIDGSSQAILFGLGFGEQLAYALKHHPEVEITAWDRDPCLLRQVLTRHELSGAIRTGRLHLLLGADLLDLPRLQSSNPAIAVIKHPFLFPIYENDFTVLEHGIQERTVLLCTGPLFVDDLADAFRASGFTVLLFDVTRLATEELEYAMRKARPDLVAAINYCNGLAEFCESFACPLLCWEVDPSLDRRVLCNAKHSDIHIFSYRRKNLNAYADAGLRNLHYLPLASHTGRRRPTPAPHDERDYYDSRLSFVGSSLILTADHYRKRFMSLYQDWRGKGDEGAIEALHTIRAILDIQAKDYSRYVIDVLMWQRFADFIAWHETSDERDDPVLLVAEIAAAEKRRHYVCACADLGIDVWGDNGWHLAVAPGIRYRGNAGHGQQLCTVYSHADINLDIGRIYQADIVTMRVFDVLACGSFLLAEWNEELESLFRIGVELDAYRDLAEMKSKIAFYLKNPDLAQKIAREGMAAVRTRHSIELRLQEMLSVLKTD